MYYVGEHHPDCRVFVKRLVTPKISEFSGGLTMTESERKVRGLPSTNTQVSDAFSNYYPKEFRKDLIDFYNKNYSPTKINEQIEKTEQDINSLEGKLGYGPFTTEQEKDYYNTEQEIFQLKWNNMNLRNSLASIQPIYEPYLLEIILGITSVTTTITRTGIGTASIVIKLPLEENGIFDNILFAIKSDGNNSADDEMWTLDKNIETIMADKAKFGTTLSSRQMSILKTIRDDNGNVIRTDKRQCELLPHDMLQIWFPKRYTERNNLKEYNILTKFPNNYVPAFTGFIKGTRVDYTSGQNPSYTITIDCEDVGHILRITRANIDPAVDPRFRFSDLPLTAFMNKLQQYGNESLTSEQIIRSLIEGRAGYWWGVSQVESIDDMQYDSVTGLCGIMRGTKIIQLPWAFNKVHLNIFTDLINTDAWKPYVAAFKNSFRLWESDYKYRWDICKEVAEVMEFEFYADGFGVINYHPPLYNWNPATPKYLIENKEIISESHRFDETNVVTVVEVVAQPQFGVIDNVCKILSSYANADTEFIQRYGVRFRTKNIPFLSGTEQGAKSSTGSDDTYTTRYLYARAWLNRRNAEIQSATIEIPGTPDLCLCNTVAFVDDINDLTKKLAIKSIGIPIGKEHIEVGISGFVPGMSENIKKIINDFKVYYISAISHKYQQGGTFTTTLTLTHGRKWGTKFNVGYSFSSLDHDSLYEAQLGFFGQDKDKVMQMKKAIDKANESSFVGPILEPYFTTMTTYEKEVRNRTGKDKIKITGKIIYPKNPVSILTKPVGVTTLPTTRQ